MRAHLIQWMGAHNICAVNNECTTVINLVDRPLLIDCN